MPAIRPVGNPCSLLPREATPPSFDGYRYCDLLDSGTAALARALLLIKKNSKSDNPEVIIPAYACPDLIAAAQFAQCKAIIVDTEANSPRIDKQALPGLINTNTIAIIGVTLLGIREDIHKMKDLAGEKITVIEDSAQWFPSNESQNFDGDMVILSFGRGKPVSISSGGILLHNLPDNEAPKSSTSGIKQRLYWTLKLATFNILLSRTPFGLLKKIPSLGIGQTRFQPLKSIEAMPSEIALILTANIEEFCRRTPSIAQGYRSFFNRHPNEHLLDLPSRLNVPEEYQLLRYPLLISDKQARSRIIVESEKLGLGLSTMYPQTLDQFSATRDLCTAPNATINSQEFSRQLITLPTHTNVKTADTDKILQLLKNYL